MSRGSLLETTRALIERTYRLDSGLPGLASFVIGDAGYRGLYASAGRELAVGAAGPAPARTLLRETPDGLRACIYFPDSLIRRLEAYPPQRGLGEENVHEFATFVEEIDHLLLVATRMRCRRSLTLFELELHANVSKHLMLARFLAGRRGHLGEDQRVWLRRSLFGGRFCDADPAVRSRYREAARWAVRFVDRLRSLEPAGRLAVLRRFHQADAGGKVRMAARRAA